MLPPDRLPISVLSSLKGFVSPIYRAVDILAPTTPPMLPPFSTTCGTRDKIPGNIKNRCSFDLSIVPEIAESMAHIVSMGRLSLIILEKEYLSFFVLIPMESTDNKNIIGRNLEEMCGKNLKTILAEIRMARIVIMSPNMGRIGAITLSGSIPFLKKKTVRKKTKGISIADDIKALKIAMSVSLKTPTDPKWRRREKPCAIEPKNIAIPILRLKETSIFSFTREESLKTGFINPTCSIVLIREPNAVPMFPLISVIAGTSMSRPGSSFNSSSILPRNIPVNPSPIVVKIRTGRVW